MTRDLDVLTTRALDGLDAAPAAPLTPEQVQRADLALARILAGDPADPATTSVPPRPAAPRRRTARRLALVGGLAATATVGIVGAQLVGGADRAYATWTATPHRPTTQQELSAAEDCRDRLAEALSPGATDPTGLTAAQVHRAPLVLAEQRGDWTFVVLGGAGAAEGSCLTLDGPFLGGAGSGSVGGATGTPEPREILLGSWGTAVHGDRGVSEVVGRVGSQVHRVVVHTATRGDVEATVAQGFVAAWWPSPYRPGSPVEDSVPAATVTFADGTTRTASLADFLEPATR